MELRLEKFTCSQWVGPFAQADLKAKEIQRVPGILIVCRLSAKDSLLGHQWWVRSELLPPPFTHHHTSLFSLRSYNRSISDPSHKLQSRVHQS